MYKEPSKVDFCVCRTVINISWPKLHQALIGKDTRMDA